MDDSPVNKANAFANAAEEYLSQGELSNAMEAHFRAAEQFLSAVGYTSDQEATRTLKLLYANHTRQGKELQRRLQTRSPASSPRPSSHAQQVAAVNRATNHPRGPIPHAIPATRPPVDPRRFAPQVQTNPPVQRFQTDYRQQARQHQHPSQHVLPPSGDEDPGGKSDFGSRHYFVGQSQTGSELATSMYRHPAYGGGGSVRNHVSAGPATMDVTSLDESHRSMATSHAMGSVAESSYSVVEKGPEDDPEDPFNKFWEAVENLVDRVSITGPVAFATAPIGNQPVSQEVNDNKFRERSQYSMNASLRATQMLNSYLIIPPNNPYKASDGGAQQASMTASSIGRPMFYDGGVVVNADDPHGVVGSIESNYFGIAGGQHLGMEKSSGRDARASQAGSFSAYSGGSGGSQENLGSDRFSSSRGAGGPTAASKTREELLLENHHLKQTLNALTHRMALLERTTEENNMLKSSIIQFRQDVQRQAVAGRGRRTGMGVSMISGREGGRERDRERERELEAKIRHLEGELQRSREEGQRMNTAMGKYKERWDKLKEAKRKKEAASSSGPGSVEDSKPGRPSPSPSPSMQHIYGSTPPSDMSHPPSPPPTAYGTSPRGGDGTFNHHGRRDSFSASTTVPSSLSGGGGVGGRADGTTSSTAGGVTIPPPNFSGGSNNNSYRSGDPPPLQQQSLGRSMVSFAGDRSMFYSATSGSGFE
ncbi:hypothetical protein HKX48_003115 [Thoreauomyces humboldtii]|nr:hypothetical protein HKX48_003115 [Thoreauomyces humboldtii]